MSKQLYANFKLEFKKILKTIAGHKLYHLEQSPGQCDVISSVALDFLS